MIKQCSGCGAYFQVENPEMAGYIEPEVYDEASICRRCFRLRNYGDYSFINKTNEDYINILLDINKTNDLVLYVVDIFNINNMTIMDIQKYIHNPMILVITKRDVLPKSVNDKKIIDYLDRFDLNIVDIVFISSHKNYNFDRLYGSIQRHKKSQDVYVVGNTNAGKSTLINKLVHNYSTVNTRVTTSYMPSTTVEMLKIKLDDKLTLIDTPGLLDITHIMNFIDSSMIVDLTPRSEMKPRTFQIVREESLLIHDLCRLDYLDGKPNSITVYIANAVDVKKINLTTVARLKDYEVHEYDIDGEEDIVVNGLCWFKIVGKGKFRIQSLVGVRVYSRSKII